MEKRNSSPKIAELQAWEFNGIFMGHAVSTYPTLHLKNLATNSRDTVRLHMGLRGDYAFKYGQLDSTYKLIGGHHNIMYSDGISLEVENKSEEIETFGIEFPKAMFVALLEDEDDDVKAFCGQVLKGNSVIMSEKWGTITTPIQKTIDELTLNPYKGTLLNIFLYAKALELLVLCIDNYKNVASRNYNYLKTDRDRAAIIAARDFLNKRISSPPTLTEIARTVHINEFKLKYGFKEMFGNTLFAYLTEKRLGLATILLRDSDKTIAAISEELGYSSPQHFSAVYKSRMGKSPSAMRKN